MAGRRKRDYDLELVSDINVTSLVDVMIEQGIDVNLPTARPNKIDVSDVVTVAVSSNERIYLENQRVTPEELAERLSNIRTANPAAAVLVKADARIEYGQVIGVLDVVREAGISRLAMATRPNE